MKLLVIIEATGKKAQLNTILSRLLHPEGHTITVLATKGHVGASHPGRIGLDNQWRDIAYGAAPARRTEIASIARASAAADEIIIATDDDAEGDVIARDIWMFAIQRPAYRCRLRALDAASVRTALGELERFDPQEDTRPLKGDVRRIVDRAIGMGLSDISNPQNKKPVGRVFSSALAALATGNPTLGHIVVTAPAKDGGKPFVAEIPLKKHDKAICHHEWLSPLPALSVHRSVIRPIKTPWNYADTLFHGSRTLNTDLKSTAKMLQTAYENGKITYPRALSREVSVHGLSVCSEIANRNGATFFAEKITPFTKSSAGAHGAICLTDSISTEMSHAPTEDRLVRMIARNLIESGIDYLIEYPETNDLPENMKPYGEFFMRITPQGFLGWKHPPVKNGAQMLTTELSLLLFLTENNLGQPGTWVKHVSSMLDRGIVSDTLELTQKGRDLLSLAQGYGIDANFSNRIESVFDIPHTFTPQMVQEAIKIGSEKCFFAIEQAIALENLSTPIHENKREEDYSSPSL